MRRTLVVAALFITLVASAQPTTGAPRGWLLAGDKPQNYTTGIEDGGTAYLASKVVDTGGFGTLMQFISAHNYLGQRVRFRAMVRSQDVRDWAGLWMRVDKGTQAVAFDNMQSHPIKGTNDWKLYEVVLDVPTDATSLSFGALVAGAGEVRMNHVSIEVVTSEVPTTARVSEGNHLSLTPVNLDFRQ
jgi:hypothetical protein